MSETAQIILALGAALAAVLFAVNGPLATVLNRGASPRPPSTRAKLTRREWWLVISGCVAALPGIVTLLEHLV